MTINFIPTTKENDVTKEINVSIPDEDYALIEAIKELTKAIKNKRTRG